MGSQCPKMKNMSAFLTVNNFFIPRPAFVAKNNKDLVSLNKKSTWH